MGLEPLLRESADLGADLGWTLSQYSMRVTESFDGSDSVERTWVGSQLLPGSASILQRADPIRSGSIVSRPIAAGGPWLTTPANEAPDRY